MVDVLWNYKCDSLEEKVSTTGITQGDLELLLHPNSPD